MSGADTRAALLARDDRSLNGPFDRPWPLGPAKTLAKNLLLDARVAGQFGHREGTAFVFEKYVRHAIVALFSLRRPTTVLRRIAEVVVYAIDGVIQRRALAHVGQEVCERRSPSIADRNSPLAIMLKGRAAGLCAARNHIPPASVCGGSFAAAGRRIEGVGMPARSGFSHGWIVSP